jgi:hypothetical protein
MRRDRFATGAAHQPTPDIPAAIASPAGISGRYRVRSEALKIYWTDPMSFVEHRGCANDIAFIDSKVRNHPHEVLLIVRQTVYQVREKTS